MKFLSVILSLVLCLLLTSCAKPQDIKITPCSDLAAVGSWHETSVGDTLNLSASCAGTGTYCAETFTYSRPNTVGDVTIRTLTTNGNVGCLSVGDHVCNAAIAGTTMNLNCGAGSVVYQKQ